MMNKGTCYIFEQSLTVIFSLIATVFAQDESPIIVTARKLDNVSFDLRHGEITVTSGHFQEAFFSRNDNALADLVLHNDSFYVRDANERVTVGLDNGFHQPYSNFHITIPNVQESDSDIYTFTIRIANQTTEWILYVLDMPRTDEVIQLIKEGTEMTNDVLPNLSEDTIQRMQLSVAWYLLGHRIECQALFATANHQMHDKNLTYEITNTDGVSTSVNLQLNIAYVKDVSIETNARQIRCHAECNPECNISWLKDGRQIGGTSGILTLTADAVGVFTCLATIAAVHLQRNQSILIQDYRGSSNITIYALFGVCLFILIAAVLVSLITGFIWWRNKRAGRLVHRKSGKCGSEMDVMAAGAPDASSSRKMLSLTVTVVNNLEPRPMLTKTLRSNEHRCVKF